ncbi:MAG: site-specific integrase [Candidatus Hodarchaeales archaeon]
MTRVLGDRKKRSILSDKEFNKMLTSSRVHNFEFLSYRNPAILCTLRISGKRREEIAALKYNDLWMDDDYIYFNFILLKKHEEKPPEKVKRTRIDGPLSAPILDYVKYVEKHFEDTPVFLWPSVRNYFGHTYYVELDKGITGRTVYDVVRDAGDSCGVNVWPHLFRETVGGNVVKRDPSLMGIAKVKNRLDITERTAWHYMDRYVRNEMTQDYDEEELPQ